MMSLESLLQVYSSDQIEAGLFALGYQSSLSEEKSRQLEELSQRIQRMKPSEMRRWLELKRASSLSLAESQISRRRAVIDSAITADLDATISRLISDKQRSDELREVIQSQTERYTQFKRDQEKIREEHAAAARLKEQRILAQKAATDARLLGERRDKWRATEDRMISAEKLRSQTIKSLANDETIKKRQDQLLNKYNNALNIRNLKAQAIADKASLKKKTLEQKELERKAFWHEQRFKNNQQTQKKLEKVRTILESNKKKSETNYITHFNKLLNTRQNHQKILSARSESVRSARDGAFAKNKSLNENLMRARSESARSYHEAYEKSRAHVQKLKNMGIKNGVDIHTHLNTKNKLLALAHENAERITLRNDRKQKFLLRKIQEVKLLTDAKLRDRHILHNYKSDAMRLANIKKAAVCQLFQKAETEKKKIVRTLAAVGIDPTKLGLWLGDDKKNDMN